MLRKFQKLSLLALSLGCALLIVLFSLPTAAQVSLSPLMVVMDLQNGQGQQLITVRNRTDKAYRARIYTEPFTYTSNGLQSLSSSDMDLTPYLVFSPREVELQPRTERNVRLVARVPREIQNKELRAVLYVQDLREVALTSPDAIAQAAISSRIGMPIYARIGNVAPSLTVVDAKYQPDQKRVAIRVKNTGLGSTRAWINWTLSGQGQQPIEGKETPSSIVASSQRDIYIENNPAVASLKPGTYQLSGSLDTERERNQQTFKFNVAFEVPQPKGR
ncbi:fimbrial biogenesis chaperone [Anabaenopsis elenkinii]|uniref:P pilus assembly protein, chaperone PapD n=1 Tax=Anabaenopsis elenkinii CCIBt3563 TaxID=2779889 RepID=A0A7S6U6L3_9CYAN|nr:hypothetical protein [Anabaenopsis elenkinii]QOV23879.1 hypothetical protein IM676_06250 [Anabaenopsis elenkinii CCIBt3563]